MSYPQDPNNPYGQPEQNPYGQGAPNQNPYGQQGQNPYGQPAQSQPGGLYDSSGNPAPFGQSGQNPYGQPGNPYDPNNSAAPTQIYGQPGNPYGPPNPFDASGGQIPQQPYGQPQQPYGMAGYPQQQQPFYGGQPPVKNNTGMIIGIVVAAVVVLGAGGFFLASSHKNPTPGPVVVSLQSGQPSGAPTGSQAAPTGGGGGGGLGSFTPPSTYSSNALENDPGCGDFAGGEADFLTSSIDMTSTSEANSAFDKLAAETTTSATDAQDPTLKAAFTAEAAYIKANEPALSAGMVAYDSSATQFTQAYAPLKPTDEYLNGVCGLASWSPTEP